MTVRTEEEEEADLESQGFTMVKVSVLIRCDFIGCLLTVGSPTVRCPA